MGKGVERGAEGRDGEGRDGEGGLAPWVQGGIDAPD